MNVGFLTSGKQFTPPRNIDMEGGEAYKSSAKRLAEFHAKTQAAAEKAAKDGLAPVAQAISPLTEYARTQCSMTSVYRYFAGRSP